MGVRFRCPNGHRLNVKSFLAGKRGICPKCGVRVQIPLSSQDDADSATPAASTRQVDVSPSLADGIAQPPTEAGAAAIDMSSPAVQQVAHPASPGVSDGSATEVPVAKAAWQTSSGNPTVQSDPVSETPDAIWYVRPPSGNQYGPASGDVVRSWVAEGRVTAECLVWREGWPDWRRAGTLFADLQKSGFVSTPPNEAVPLAIETGTERRGRSKASTSNVVTLVVVLAIVSVVLLGALIYVTTVL